MIQALFSSEGKGLDDDDDSEEYGSITTVNSRRKRQPLVQDKVVAHGKKSRDKPNAEWLINYKKGNTLSAKISRANGN